MSLFWGYTIFHTTFSVYYICKYVFLVHSFYWPLFYWLCRSKLRTYAHDDVSVGSWFIGLDVSHINERKFCCSSWASGQSLFSSLTLHMFDNYACDLVWYKGLGIPSTTWYFYYVLNQMLAISVFLWFYVIVRLKAVQNLRILRYVLE